MFISLKARNHMATFDFWQMGMIPYKSPFVIISDNVAIVKNLQ